MRKILLPATAVALSLAGLGACAAPQPRYAIVPDPLSATQVAGREAPTVLEAPDVAAAGAAVLAAAEPEKSEVEVPRAAPLGRVETVALAELPPPPEAAPAPAASTAPAAAPADATLSHVVGPGDTFFAVARRYGVGPQAIAELNGLTFESTLRLGQRLQLPVGARDKGGAAARAPSPPEPAATAAAPVRATVVEPEAPVIAAPPVSAPTAAPAPVVVAPAPMAAAPAPVIVPPVSRPAPQAPVVVAPPPPIVAATPPPAAASAPVLPGRGLFVWPLRGDVLSGFGPKGVGQRSDGVNISAAEGDPVRAAAGGTVVYAGDQVKGGFGKLVLIEHENRWFTAYAHLSDITVRMKDRIAQNQQIGRAGRTGNVGAPQLYFEVRHAPVAGERARPVDPVPLLPE